MKRPAETVAWLGDAGDPGAVLGEKLAAGAGQPAGRAVQHVHRPRLGDAADVLERNPDG